MYKLGNHRLFYQSKDDSNVTVTMRTPDLELHGPFDMTFVEDKLYYFDAVFYQTGSHVFSVYENGVRQHREILPVSNGSLILYPEE